jgi:hypothetical protein
MSKSKNEVVNEINENNVNESIDRLFDNNEQFKSLKKICEKDKDNIKSYMLSANIMNIETGKAKATITEINKESYKETELIDFLKTFDIPGLIVNKPVIDMEILQDSIYHGDINPVDIKPFIVTDTTYRFDIKKVKTVKNDK